MRKLASVQVVRELNPIDGADRIERASILGWECVVKKGDFKEGELCVYFEIDSILPKHEVFDFMAPRKYRVRTAKFMKQIAQGLAMPTSIIKEITSKEISLKEGKDLTELLCIVKHDPFAKREAKYKRQKVERNPIIKYMLSFPWYRKLHYHIYKRNVKNFPWFIKKTDEERVQNLPYIFQQRNGDNCYMMEKLDGSSGTYAYFVDTETYNWFYRLFVNPFFVCSRNIHHCKNNDSEWWEIAKKFDIREKLKSVGKNIAIQGECVGPKIQGNKLKLPELDYYVFNVIDLDENYYYTFQEKLNFCMEYDFKHAPIVGEGLILGEHVISVNEMIEFSKRKSLINPDVWVEGIVIRSYRDDRQSFKAINPELLIGRD